MFNFNIFQKDTSRYDEDGDVIMKDLTTDCDGDVEMKNMSSVSFGDFVTVVEYKLTDFERQQKQRAFQRANKKSSKYGKRKVKRKKYNDFSW